MSRRLKKAIVSIVGLVLALVALPLLPPVLGEPFSACACLEARYAILNPFRDRSPESAAHQFLSQIASGELPKVTTGAELGSERWTLLVQHARTGVNLINRRSEGGELVIVFKSKDHALIYVGLRQTAAKVWTVDGAWFLA